MYVTNKSPLRHDGFLHGTSPVTPHEPGGGSDRMWKPTCSNGRCRCGVSTPRAAAAARRSPTSAAASSAGDTVVRPGLPTSAASTCCASARSRRLGGISADALRLHVWRNPKLRRRSLPWSRCSRLRFTSSFSRSEDRHGSQSPIPPIRTMAGVKKAWTCPPVSPPPPFPGQGYPGSPSPEVERLPLHP